MRWLRWFFGTKILRLQPGDVLMIYLHRPVSADYLNAARLMREVFPDNTTLFLDDNVDRIEVVRKLQKMEEHK